MKKRYARKIFITGICTIFLFQSVAVMPKVGAVEKQIELNLEGFPKELPVFESEEEVFQEEVDPPLEVAPEEIDSPLEVVPIEIEDSLEPKNEDIQIEEESQVDKDSDIEEISKTSVFTGTFGTAPWVFDDDTGELTIGNPSVRTAFDGTGANPNWHIHRDLIVTIVFVGEVFGGEHLENTFVNHTALVSIENIELLDVSETKDMRYMFSGANSLKSLDLSGWDTSNALNMSYMFQDTSSLETLDLSSWNTSNVTNMTAMFLRASSLETLDLSSWNTGKLTNISRMFSNTRALENLNVNSFDTSNVTDMSYVFEYMTSLESIEISNWNTENVTSMLAMFQSANSLKEINKSDWDTSKVTDMTGMFAFAVSIETLDLNEWDTSALTRMAGMFINMTELRTLDISNFDTRNVTVKSVLFAGNVNLKSLSLGGNFISQDTANLPAVTTTGYSGRWVGKNTGTLFESSLDFMTNKGEGMADTYVWEEAVIEIKIPVKMIFHGSIVDSTIINSPDYSITNESNVSMNVFISENESTELDALVNLKLNEIQLVDNGVFILSDETKLMTLEESDMKQMSFSGEVTPDLANEINPSFNLTFKFSISRD